MGLFSNYDVEEVIAEGELATVYKCSHTSHKQTVAVKVMSQQLMSRHPESAKIFAQSSTVIAKLNHPNIVQIIDRGAVGQLPYFVMKYIDGMSLDDAIKNRALNFNQKLNVALQISKALAYAHKNRIIHRKLKPANVLIDRDDNIQITDFGIAQLANVSAGAQDSTYMSPEQKTGRGELSATDDIYSLGVIMYEMFAGQLPDESLNLASYYDSTIPAYLDEVIASCLSQDPKDRYSSAEAVKDKLLESMWGAHINEPATKRALRGLGDINTQFVLLDVIQETKFGGVYLAENNVNHNNLVIKKIVGTKEGYKECTVLSNLQHPHVVNIYGTSTDEGLFIVLMEYLAGGSLSDRLVIPWEWKKAIKIIREVCLGMVFIHDNNLVHGNLRPSNILFTRRGEAKVTDCALSEHYSGEKSKTNSYVYPGQAKSTLTDMYSIGAILFEMVAGIVPVIKRNELMVNARFRALPANFQGVLKRMLAIVPKDRFRDFREVIEELDGLMGDSRVKSEKTPKPESPGVNKFLLFIAALTAVFALAFTFQDATNGVIESVKTILGF